MNDIYATHDSDEAFEIARVLRVEMDVNVIVEIRRWDCDGDTFHVLVSDFYLERSNHFINGWIHGGFWVKFHEKVRIPAAN